ncbi:MAG: putative Ig domain-containing protein, partial [Paludibacteraceae bacterium]|nr:putative Ig domain-containing protein [Paludibacteraceae bacterium]
MENIFKLRPITIGLVILCFNLLGVGALADNYVYLGVRAGGEIIERTNDNANTIFNFGNFTYDNATQTQNYIDGSVTSYRFTSNSCSVTPRNSITINNTTYFFVRWAKYHGYYQKTYENSSPSGDCTQNQNFNGTCYIAEYTISGYPDQYIWLSVKADNTIISREDNANAYNFTGATSEGTSQSKNNTPIYLYKSTNNCNISAPQTFQHNGKTYDFVCWDRYQNGNESHQTNATLNCSENSAYDWPNSSYHYTAVYTERIYCTATITDPGSTLYDGESYTLTATITSQQNYSRQWQRSTDGTNWQNISSATNDTYTFTANSNSNYTYYRLLVTNDDGTTCESNVVHFTVESKYIWLAVRINNSFISRGDNADAYNFTGAVYANQGPESNSYLYRTTNNCNITAPQLVQHNNKTYEFVRWDRYHNGSRTTNVSISGNCKPGTNFINNHQQYLYAAIYEEVVYCTATIYSSASTLNEGDACTLTASVSSEQNYTLQWQRSEDGTAWENISNATSSTYSFNANSDITYYRLIVTTADGTCESNSIHLTINKQYTMLGVYLIGYGSDSYSNSPDLYQFSGVVYDGDANQSQSGLYGDYNTNVKIYRFRDISNCNVSAPQLIQKGGKNYQFREWRHYSNYNYASSNPPTCSPHKNIYDQEVNGVYYIAIYEEVEQCTATLSATEDGAIITDELYVGHTYTLSANTANVTGSIQQYQWKMQLNGGEWTNLGTTNPITYTPQSSDADKTIVFQLETEDDLTSCLVDPISFIISIPPCAVITANKLSNIRWGEEVKLFVTEYNTPTILHTAQWQSSVDGTTWTDIAGETEDLLTINLDKNAPLHYRMKITYTENSNTEICYSNEIDLSFAPCSISKSFESTGQMRNLCSGIVEVAAETNLSLKLTLINIEPEDVTITLKDSLFEGTTYNTLHLSDTSKTDAEGNIYFDFPTITKDRDITLSYSSTSCGSISNDKTTIHVIHGVFSDEDAASSSVPRERIYYDDFGHFEGSTYHYTDDDGVSRTRSANDVHCGDLFQDQDYYVSDDPRKTTDNNNVALGTINHSYESGGNVNDGSYAIMEEAKFAMCGTHGINQTSGEDQLHSITDHTGNGGMLFVNLENDSKDKVIYRRKVVVDCDESWVELSFYVANANYLERATHSNHPVVAPVNVRMDIIEGIPGNGGTVIAQAFTGDIPSRVFCDEWQHLTARFKAHRGVDYYMELTSNRNGGNGDDALFDDISITVTYPDADISNNPIQINPNRHVDICGKTSDGATVYTLFKNDIHDFFENPAYQFLYRKYNTNDTWQRLGGTNTTGQYTFTTSDPSIQDGEIEIMVVVANDDAKITEILNYYNQHNQTFPDIDCNNVYAVSTPFSVSYYPSINNITDVLEVACPDETVVLKKEDLPVDYTIKRWLDKNLNFLAECDTYSFVMGNIAQSHYLTVAVDGGGCPDTVHFRTIINREVSFECRDTVILTGDNPDCQTQQYQLLTPNPITCSDNQLDYFYKLSPSDSYQTYNDNINITANNGDIIYWKVQVHDDPTYFGECMQHITIKDNIVPTCPPDVPLVFDDRCKIEAYDIENIIINHVKGKTTPLDECSSNQNLTIVVSNAEDIAVPQEKTYHYTIIDEEANASLTCDQTVKINYSQNEPGCPNLGTLSLVTCDITNADLKDTLEKDFSPSITVCGSSYDGTILLDSLLPFYSTKRSDDPTNLYTIYWQYNDNNGTEIMPACPQQIKIVDNTPPTCGNSRITIAAACRIDKSTLERELMLRLTGYDDNCTDASEIGISFSGINDNGYDFNYRPVYFINDIQAILTDKAGNSTNCSLRITIENLNLPVCPSIPDKDIYVEDNLCTIAKNDLEVILKGQNDIPNINLCNSTLTPVYDNTNLATYATCDVSDNRYRIWWHYVNRFGAVVGDCSQDIYIKDSIKPTCTPVSPAAITIDNACTATSSDASVSFSDNCGVKKIAWQATGATSFSGEESISGNTSSHSLSGQAFNVGKTTILWTVTDIHDNIEYCTSVVEVFDGRKPISSDCETNKTQTIQVTNTCSVQQNELVLPTASITQCNSYNDFTTTYKVVRNGIETDITGSISTYEFSNTTLLRTYFTRAGNSAYYRTTSTSCDQTIIVKDISEPQQTGTWPSNITNQNNCLASANTSSFRSDDYIKTLFSDCSELTVTHTDDTTGNNCGWTINRNYTIQDTSGNFIVKTMSISGKNQTPPIIGDVVAPTIEAAGNCQYKMPDLSKATEAVSLDNCGNNVVFISQSIAPGTPITQTNTPQSIKVTVTVEDGCGLRNSKDVYVEIPASTLSLSEVAAAHKNVSCYGESDGELQVVASGGYGSPYTYSLGSTTNTTGIFTNLAKGNHVVSVIDGNGCEESITIAITEPDLLEVTVATPAAYCSGNFTSLEAVVTGGTAIYSYSWTPSDDLSATNTAKVNASPTETKTYTVNVTDAHNCTASQQVTVSVYPLPVIELTPITNTLCPTIGTQEITATITSPTTPNYTYQFIGDLTFEEGSFTTTNTSATATATIPTNCNGEYIVHVYVIDNNNCHSNTPSTSVKVKDETNPTITVNSGKESVDAVRSANCEYAIPTLNTTDFVTVSDACTTDELVITQSPAAGTKITQTQYVNIIVTDGCGKTATAHINVIVPSNLSVTANGTSTICKGESKEISATVTGGTPTYSYSWTPTTDLNKTDEASVVATPTETATYTVTVTDDNECTASGEVTITVLDPAVALNNISNQTICKGNSATLAATISGTPVGTVTYAWSSADANAGLPNDLTTQSISVNPTATSTYKVTATATVTENGKTCTVTDEKTVTVTVNPLVELSATNLTQTVCKDNAITDVVITSANATVTTSTLPAGLTFAGGKISGTPSTAGVYTITITATSNQTPACDPKTETFNLTVNALPNITTESTNVLCKDADNGTITVTASGATLPYQYSKDGGSTYQTSNEFTDLSPATYPIQVKDKNGCLSSIENVTITEPEALTAVINAPTPGCPGLTYNFTSTVTGGTQPYTYSWTSGEVSGSDQAFALATADNCDTYTVNLTVTDKNNCRVSATPKDLTTVNATVPTITTTKKNQTLSCNASAPELTSADFTVTDPCNNSASATVTSESAVNGCIHTKTYKANYTNSCGVPATEVTITYTWTESAPPTISALTVPAETAGNCQYKMPDLSSAVVAASTSSCGGAITFVSQSITAGTSYTQESTVQNITVSVTVEDTCGQQTSKDVTVTIPANNHSVTASSDVTICKGSTTTLTATSATATSYAWSPVTGLDASNVASVTASPTATTTYTVTATDANGCTASDEVVVTINPLVELSTTGSLSQVVCVNTAIETINITNANSTVSVSGLPAGLTFSDNKISGTPTSAGTSEIIITATSNQTPACEPKTETFNLTVNPLPTFTTSSTDALCKDAGNGTITVSASGATSPYQYSKDGGTTYQTSNEFTNLSPATYPIQVKDNNGCLSAIENVTITEPNKLEVTITAPNAACPGASYVFTAAASNGTPDYAYVWSDDASGNNASATIVSSATEKSKTYTATVTVTDNNGCTATDTKTLLVEDNTKPECPASEPAISLDATDVSCEFTSDVMLAQLQTKNYGTDNCTNTQNIVVGLVNPTETFTYDNTHPTTKVISYTLTDAVGNTQTCNATVVVNDNIQPVCDGLPATLELKTPCELTKTEIETIIKSQLKWKDNCTDVNDIVVTIDGLPTSMKPGDQATISISLNDTHGNTNSNACSQTINVVFDNEPDCPNLPNVTLQVESGCSLSKDQVIALLNDNGATMIYCNDNKAGVLQTNDLTNEYAVVTDGSFNYVAKWTFQLTPSISKSGCEQKFTVLDSINPTCTNSSITQDITDATNCSYEIEVSKPTITENCSVAKVEYKLTSGGTNSELSGTSFNQDFNLDEQAIVYWTITDNSGNTGTCQTTVLLTDKTKPSCPANTTIAFDDVCSKTKDEIETIIASNANGYASSLDNCSQNNALTISVLDADAQNANSEKTYSYTITDAKGNESETCSQTIKIEIADFSITQPEPHVVACISEAIIPTDFLPVVNDALGQVLSPSSIPTEYNYPAENAYNDCEGDIQYVYTYTDCANHSHDLIYTYRINKPAEPALASTWPADNTSIEGCYASIPAFPSNNEIADLFTASCDKTISVTSAEKDGTVTDNCGWQKTMVYTISDGCSNVIKELTYAGGDNSIPTITAKVASEEAVRNSNCSYTVPDLCSNTYVQWSDDCYKELTLTQSPAAGDDITATGNVTITVSDGCGHSATAQISVVVPEVLSVTIAAPTAACPGDNYTFTATASNGTPDYTYEWSGDASGNTSSATIESSATVKSKTYTATVTVTDNNGCTATDTKTLLVEDNMEPECPTSEPAISLDATDASCEFANSVVLAQLQTKDYGTDNCTNAQNIVVSLVNTTETFTYDNTHPTKVISYTLTDAVGNTQTCNASVVVNDNIQPVCDDLPSTLELKTPCELTQAEIENDIIAQKKWHDNCTTVDNISVTITGVPETMKPGDHAEIYITLDDTHGNVNTNACSQTINVVFDNEPNCPNLPDVTLQVESGCSLSKDQVIALLNNNDATMDYCGTPKTGTLQQNDLTDSYDVIPAGSFDYVAKWTFQLTPNISKSGCEQKFTVLDRINPTCTNASITQEITDATNCAYSIDIPQPEMDDNCSIVKIEYTLTSGGANTELSGTSFNQEFNLDEETIVYWTVTDNSGNTGTCQTTVLLTDKTKPSCPTNTTIAFDDVCSKTKDEIEAIIAGNANGYASSLDNCSQNNDLTITVLDADVQNANSEK